MSAAPRSVLLVGLLAALAAGCGEDAPTADTPGLEPVPTVTAVARLPGAFDACDADDVTDVISLADAGRTVLVETRTEYGATQPVNCLFSLLGVSAALTSEVEATTSVMGRQQATEGNLTYSWSYHPDTGLKMVITENMTP